MLMLDEEKLFESAHRIAAVMDTYEQITNEDTDYLDEDEATFLLKYYNPLEMVADYLQERQAGYPLEIDEALMELFNADNHEENYLTMEYAEELTDKYGDDVHMKTALLYETIEAGKRYVQLLKLIDTTDASDFFAYEGDEEGCF